MPRRLSRRFGARRAVRGATLLEALVTIVILSFSALGYAALQARGLTANAGALWRSQATAMASDASDRLRANLPGVTAGHYNALLVPSRAGTCTAAAPCSAAEMASWDFAQWRTRLSETLPQGSGVICLDSTADDGTADEPACDGAGDRIVIKVFWSERGTPGRFVYGVRP